LLADEKKKKQGQNQRALLIQGRKRSKSYGRKRKDLKPKTARS